jgi:DNA repair exonuclease SbcCD ATPase subunit
MAQLQVDLMTLLGVLELALITLVVAVGFGLRARRLARHVRTLERQNRASEAPTEPVSYAQYLRDEVLRNEALIERARAAGAEQAAGHTPVFSLRKRFLELELDARQLESNPVAFEARIAAGMNDLMESLRPATERVVEVAAAAPASEPQPDAEEAPAAAREAHDTHDEEIDHLKQVINNQQDAMAALRAQLREHERELEGIGEVLEKLDEFEHRSAELQRCLTTLEQENERLKAAKSKARRNDADAEATQLTGLRSMVGKQQHTIGKLQNLIRELAPEAGKARELAEAFASMQRANDELNGCVAVLEDENAMLRGELEEIQARMAQQAAAAAQQASEEETRDGVAGAADQSLAEQNQQLEIKVQELEALLEFKEAAIQELEKQYNSLESRYLATTGERKADAS